MQNKLLQSLEHAALAAAATLSLTTPAHASHEAEVSPMQVCLENARNAPVIGDSVQAEVNPIKCSVSSKYVYFEHQKDGWAIQTDGTTASFLRHARMTMDKKTLTVKIDDGKALLNGARHAAQQYLGRQGR